MKKIVSTLSEVFQMELLISSLIAFVLGMLLLATSAKAETEAAKTQPGMIKIDGSSTVFPITEAVSEEFQGQQKGKVKVTVGISGTGGGFKKFCRGETDVQNASRPIQTSEMETCKAPKLRSFSVVEICRSGPTVVMLLILRLPIEMSGPGAGPNEMSELLWKSGSAQIAAQLLPCVAIVPVGFSMATVAVITGVELPVTFP